MNYSILNQEAVQQLMTSFGFNSLDQVDQLETITDYYNYLEKTDQKDLMNNGSQKFRQAKYISAVLKNQARDTLFVNEPVANTLRDFRLPFDERNNPLDMSVSSLQKLLPEEVDYTASEALSQDAPTRYVKPSSIQSTQSPAAYLKYIYDLAKAIENVNPDFDLIARRPDLQDLVLNEDNLHQEVTTLELANELLIAQYLEKSKKRVLSFRTPCRMETSVDIDLEDKDFTIEFWARAVRLSVESFTKALKLVTQPNDCAYVSFTKDAETRFWFNPGIYTNSGIGSDNKWHHFACTFNNNDDTAKIFKDGEDLNAQPGNRDDNLKGKLAPINIAQSDLTSDNAVEICEIRIWNTARSEQQIQEFMNKVVQPTDDDYQNLLAYFPGDYIDGKLLNLIDTENFAEPELNPENFKQVIVALPADTAEAELYENLNNTFHPLELPFHKNHSEVRYALAAIQDEMSLSQIARRIKQNDFAFKDTDFTLIPNLVDRLNLYQSHLEVLQETPELQTMYRDWYGVEEIPIEPIEGLQLDLPLNEIVDGKVIDRSPNNFECTVHGDAQIVDDSMFGKCIKFDGVDDYIEIPPEAIQESNEITMSFWAYGDSSKQDTSIISAVDENHKRVVNIHLPSGRNYHFDCGNQGGDFDRISKEDTDDYSKEKWTYWVFTKDVATGSMKIYVNGTLWHSGEDKTKPINPVNKVVLGNLISEDGSLSDSYWYKGKVAQFQIYNRELSPAEIGAKYSSLSQVENFREATKLSIEEFNQFYRNYRVKDDADNSYKTNEVYATYISDDHNLTLNTVGEKLVMGYDEEIYVNDDFFYRFNRIIRLQKRTNIPYYQLDWLLNTVENTEGLIDDDRLNVVAHYLYWNHKYQFSVDEFVGILTEVNSYRRMGEQETSLLRKIFGNGAAALVEVLKDSNTKFVDLESTIKEYLIIGLRITFAEYDAIVKAITNDDENQVFDKAALARMYRLVKVFTLFEWGIAKGIELVEKLELTDVFAHPGEKVSDVLSALDKLVSLSEWINAEVNNLKIDNILTILTPPDKAGTLQPTVEVDEFLDLLAQDIQEQRVVEFSFTNYESWEIIEGDDENTIQTITISAEDWYQLLQEQEEEDQDEEEQEIITIIDNYGLVLNVETKHITERVTEIINDKIAEEEEGYQLTEAAEEQKQELIVEIENFQRRQQESLAKIITEKLSELSQEIIPVILLWMETDYYQTLKQLLGWQYPDADEEDTKLNQETLKLLYNINRHGIVVSQLELDTYTVLIAAEKPEWLVTDMSRDLSLEQAYYLYKFKTILNAKVSSKHWLVYLAAVNEDGFEDVAEQNKLLAAFLDWSVEDIPHLTEEIPDGWVKTVQQIEYVRRQIELCQDLHIPGEQLHQLNSANGDEAEWEAAVAAVKLGLNRQNDEVRKKIATDAINLELRDALVANFMNEVVANSELLKEQIKSWEDIYQYLLLDVNVSSQVPTTRLLEGTGTVQLYINRMIQGVENANWQDGQLENLKKDWDLSQQYRLWEANEKLGLYPSSYIEPTLRLHKTEIFEAFEQSLGQGSLSEEMVQQAVMQYLQQLQQLSELRVEGFTSQNLRYSIEFCFTAKATWEANSYYYRLLRVDKTKLEAGNKYAFEWGGWIKAELVFTQQHIYGVAPCYGWNRLYMYWFELFETRSKDGQTTKYYLQPKYCRQNTDASFGQPRNSVVVGIEGEIEPQGINIEYEGENIVEELQVQIYQPYFDLTTDQILMYFYAGVGNSLEFFSSVTSKEETVVKKTDVSLIEHEIPDGYYGIDTVPPPPVYIQPEEVTHSPIEWISILPDNRGWSNLYLTGIEMKWQPAALSSDDKVKLEWEFNCQESRYFLKKDFYDQGSSGGDRYYKYNSAIVRTWIELAASDNQFNEIVELAGENNLEGNHSLGIANNNGSIEFNKNEDKVEFDIVVKLHTNWRYVDFDNTRNIDGNEYQSKQDTLFTFYVLYNNDQSQQSVFVRKSEDNPSLADQRFLLFSHSNSFYTRNLYSTAIQRVVELAHPYYDIHQLFDLAHQQYREEGVQDYLTALENTDTYSDISDPEPDDYMDFWGPYGIYAWEIFHYIPLMVAYKYTQSQNFDLAKKWLKHVYDPTLKDNPWRNYPLAYQPNGISALGINDPDAIAREIPYYYRLSTIRQYIQNVIEQGDYYYRQITTETLRQAKMYYVEAKNLFRESTESLGNIQVGEDWSDPTLGEVTNKDFIEPYDEEIIKLYQTIEERLYNLRHWLAIDGTPLNIPLLAPPVDPRVLQQAALAGVSLTEPQQPATRTLNYDFDEILSRARGYVQDLISWSTNLLQYWENYENIQYQNLADSLGSFDSAILMQEKTIAILEKNIEIQETTKKQTQDEHDLYEYETTLIDVIDATIEKYYAAVQKIKLISLSMKAVVGGLKAIPNVFGLAGGGFRPEGAAEGVDNTQETSSDLKEILIEWYQTGSELQTTKRETLLKERQAENAIEIIDKEMEVSNIQLEIEQQVLEDIKGDKQNSETLAAFNQRRFTNEVFFKWYVDNLRQLYRTLFDQTVSFCLLAERVYQEKTGESTTFIRPQWDDVYHGLLSGQKLLLNLQQMEYTFLQKNLYEDEQPTTRTFSLEEKDDNILASLKTHGKAVIHIQESWFEEDFPEEFGRRIQSVKVKFLGLEGSDPIAAELTQISNRYSAKERTLQRVCAHGKIKLLGVETDTATMTPKQKGRLLPFEGSGVESTWLLSVPAAVKAIEKKKVKFKHKRTLRKIEDIEMTIRYTAKY